MSYKIHIEITAYRSVSSEIEIPIDHDFWKPLMLYFLNKSDSFRIDCWNAESEAITRILKFASWQDRQSNPNMTLLSGELAAVTHMKQYSNASVVYIETEVSNAEPYVRLGQASLELLISTEYQCRPDSGCGHKKGMLHSFVVIPRLPKRG